MCNAGRRSRRKDEACARQIFYSRNLNGLRWRLRTSLGKSDFTSRTWRCNAGETRESRDLLTVVPENNFKKTNKAQKTEGEGGGG